VTIRVNIGRNTTRDKWNGMIMEATRRWDSLVVVENRVVFEEDKLHVRMNSGGGSLNCLSGMEVDNNAKMFFLRIFSI
jgi:hypothetical protein